MGQGSPRCNKTPTLIEAQRHLIGVKGTMRKTCWSLVRELLFHTEPQMSHKTMEGARCFLTKWF